MGPSCRCQVTLPAFLMNPELLLHTLRLSVHVTVNDSKTFLRNGKGIAKVVRRNETGVWILPVNFTTRFSLTSVPLPPGWKRIVVSGVAYCSDQSAKKPKWTKDIVFIKHGTYEHVNMNFKGLPLPTRPT